MALVFVDILILTNNVTVRSNHNHYDENNMRYCRIVIKDEL